jgi:DNA invertase Pin-like site-specific DNA recombinase
MTKKSSSKTAAYLRVSSAGQDAKSQRAEVRRWLEEHGVVDAVEYSDKATGRNLERPAFEKMEAAIRRGEVKTVVVFKLDRLSRSIRDGVALLCDWLERGVRIVSTSQQLDFSGPTGKLLAAVLFALSEMEISTRRERTAAGLAVAKANGIRLGGSPPKWMAKKVAAKAPAVKKLLDSGESLAAVARTTGLSIPTVRCRSLLDIPRTEPS